jgi:hypothetical protein
MRIVLISYNQALHTLASRTVGKSRTGGASFAAEVVLVLRIEVS